MLKGISLLKMKRILFNFRQHFLFQKAGLLILVFFLASGRAWSTNYYSGGNNAPNQLASWWTISNGTGSHPLNFISGDIFIIQAAHTMTTTASWTVSGAGSGVQVNGTLVASSAVSAPAWTFAAGSTYQHAQNGGTIPTASWDPTSNCNITGIVNSTVLSGLGQTFGNFTWNCPGQTSNLYMASNITIAGDFTVSGTGVADPNNHALRMSNTATSYTITVAGNFIISNNSSFKMNNSTGSCTMIVGGNFTLSSGNFTIVTGAANSILSVAGDVTISGGTLNMQEDNGANVGTLNLAQNFIISGGGTITETGTGTGTGAINFNGSTTKTYSKTGGTISQRINFTVNNSSILDVGTSLIDGSTGTFTLSSGAGIITAHATGLSTAGATGSIRVTGTRTYNAGADYTYDGSVAQVTGNGLTQNSPAHNLTIANSGSAGNNTVTLSAATSISGTLTLTSGLLATTSTNLLSITNTATTAISGGSSSSFINGPVRWNIPASLASGSTYNFPVGKGITYLPFSLVNPTTGTGAVTSQVEAFNADAGGTIDATLDSKSPTEYWSLVTTGNFTNSSVSLTRQNAIAPLDAIGGSTTVAGTYTSLAGTAGTYGVAGSNIIGANSFFVLAGRMQTISTGVIAGSPFCAGANVSVPFTITGTFTAGNVFTAQLSDASGNFGSPVVLGTLTSTTAGTIPGTILGGTLTGTLYRIRVVSNSPARTGTDNGSDLVVNQQPVGPTLNTKTPNLGTVCDGTLVSATFNAGSGGVGCTDAYQYRFDGAGGWSVYILGNTINTAWHTSVDIQ